MRQLFSSLMVILLLLAVTSCAGGSNRSSTRVIQSYQGFQLMDQEHPGRVMAEMRMDRGDPMFVIYDEQGENRITATEHFLRIRDPKVGSIALEFDHDGPFITLGFEDGSDPRRIDLVELANMLAEDGNSN